MLIANLVAPPIVIFAVTGYLDSFSVHVPVTPVPFLIALGTTLIVACAAVGGRVLYAAAIRPSDALRYE